MYTSGNCRSVEIGQARTQVATARALRLGRHEHTWQLQERGDWARMYTLGNCKSVDIGHACTHLATARAWRLGTH
eukprot:2076188-Alexandrium_andersonii.AAC.1